MRYTPHTPSDKAAMLQAIGLSEIEQLFDHLPASLRERAQIALPSGLSEIADRKSTRLNSSHIQKSRMPSSA